MKHLILILMYLFPITVKAPPVEETVSVPPNLVESQIQILKEEVGTQEQRGNRGKAIRKYQEETGAIHQPWCTSFLAYTYNKNSNQYLLGDVLPKKAASQALYWWAKKHEYLTKTPEVGDIVIWRKGSSNRGHAGAIIKIEGDSIYTIEGNTKTKKQRKDGVYEKKHHIRRRNGDLRLRGYVDISKIWTNIIRKNYASHNSIYTTFDWATYLSFCRLQGNVCSICPTSDYRGV